MKRTPLQSAFVLTAGLAAAGALGCLSARYDIAPAATNENRRRMQPKAPKKKRGRK